MFLPLKTILVATNFLILGFLVILTFDHYSANNNLKSWSFLFYILCFGWLFIRGVFWLLTLLCTSTWGAFKFYTLYWVPVPMEFGSFMLIPLFFAHMVYPREYKSYRMYVRPVYVFCTSGLTIFTILWSLLSAVEQRKQQQCAGSAYLLDDDEALSRCFHTEYSGWVFRVVTAVCFLFLTITQTTFGIKLYYLTDWQRLGMLTVTKEHMIVVNVVLSISFLSRVIYQAVVGVFKNFNLPDIPLQNNADVSPALFFIILVWDYLPTVLLLLTIVSRSSGTGKMISRLRGGSNLDDYEACDSESRDGGSMELAPPLPKYEENGPKMGAGFGRKYPASLRTSLSSATDSAPVPPARVGVLSSLWRQLTGTGTERVGPQLVGSADERTRLLVSSRVSGEQKLQPLQGRIPADGLTRFNPPTLPTPVPSSWRSTVFDDPQRFWRAPGTVDKDMYAASSISSFGKDGQYVAGSGTDHVGDEKIFAKPTPLDLRLTRDSSANRWSLYAPLSTPPQHGTPPCGPNGASALSSALHAAGGGGLVGALRSSAPSLTGSSPTSSITSISEQRPSSVRLSARPPSGTTNYLRPFDNSTAQQLYWYHHHRESRGSSLGSPDRSMRPLPDIPM